MRISRSWRVVAIAMVAALVLVACGSNDADDGDARADGDGLGEFEVGMVCGGITAFTSLVAIHQDTFVDGLDVEQVCFDSGSDGVAALIGGSIDVFMGSVEHVVSTRAQGLPTLGLAVVNQRMPYWLLTPADSPYETLADTVGETVAVTRPGSLSDTQLHAAAQEQDLEYSDFEVVEGGSGATMVAAMSTGSAVAGMVSEPNTSELLHDDEYRVLWEPDFDFVSIVAIANGDHIADNEAAFGAYIDGLIEAKDHTLEDVDFAVEALYEEGYEIDEAVMQSAAENAIAEQPEDLQVDEPVYDATTDLLVNVGALDETDVPAFDDVFGFRFTE